MVKEDDPFYPNEEIPTEADLPVILPTIGEIVAFCSFCLAVFAVFLALQLDRWIDWEYWFIFMPLFFCFFILLVLTQSKKVTRKIPLIYRLAFLMLVCCLSSFIILFNLRHDATWKSSKPEYLIIPLYIFVGICLVLGLASMIVACLSPLPRRNKYLFAGIPLLLLCLILSPMLVLLQLKVTDFLPDMSWSIVFVPLWITDAVAFCMGAALLIFTFGSPDDATFSLFQVVCFVLFVMSFIGFKILLVINLDHLGKQMSYWIVMLPLFLSQVFSYSCGMHMWCRRVPKTSFEGYKELRTNEKEEC